MVPGPQNHCQLKSLITSLVEPKGVEMGRIFRKIEKSLAPNTHKKILKIFKVGNYLRK